MVIEDIDDNTLYAVAIKINTLSQQYTTGQIKHMQYADQYDRVLDGFQITKKQLIAALEKRNGKNEELIVTAPTKPTARKKPLF